MKGEIRFSMENYHSSTAGHCSMTRLSQARLTPFLYSSPSFTKEEFYVHRWCSWPFLKDLYNHPIESRQFRQSSTPSLGLDQRFGFSFSSSHGLKVGRPPTLLADSRRLGFLLFTHFFISENSHSQHFRECIKI